MLVASLEAERLGNFRSAEPEKTLSKLGAEAGCWLAEYCSSSSSSSPSTPPHPSRIILSRLVYASPYLLSLDHTDIHTASKHFKAAAFDTVRFIACPTIEVPTSQNRRRLDKEGVYGRHIVAAIRRSSSRSGCIMDRINQRLVGNNTASVWA